MPVASVTSRLARSAGTAALTLLMIVPLARSETPLSVSAFAGESAAVSLADAIVTAENHRPGSRAADVVLIKRGSKLIYEVKTLLVNEFWEGEIDAQSGRVLGPGTVTPVARLSDDETSELAALLKSRLELKEAAALAEKTTDARAISARIEEKNGRVMFEVLVRTDGNVGQVVAVDPNDGTVRSTDNGARPAAVPSR